MSILPERHREENSGFSTGLLLYVACILVAAWLFWPVHQVPYGSERYAQPGDPVGANLEGWGNRNRTGVTPRDVFGFLPGGRR